MGIVNSSRQTDEASSILSSTSHHAPVQAITNISNLCVYQSRRRRIAEVVDASHIVRCVRITYGQIYVAQSRRPLVA